MIFTPSSRMVVKIRRKAESLSLEELRVVIENTDDELIKIAARSELKRRANNLEMILLERE